MKFYSTGEVAKKLHISVRTLRYYDQIGLLSPAQKDEVGKRLYSNEDLVELEKISILKKLNLSLDNIGRVLSKLTIKQILHAHKESLQQELGELNISINHTNTLLHIVDLEGELKWEQLMPLVQNEEKSDRIEMNWNDYFNQAEQITLKERLPKMEANDPQIRKWINLIKRVELCLEKGIAPDSVEGQILAEDALILSDELFMGNSLPINFLRYENHRISHRKLPLSDK